MRKKLLIIMPSMFIGGAERSLLGLLENIDYNLVDVSLFLYRHEGEFMRYIPGQVHLLPAINEYATFDVPIASLLKGKQLFFGVARILAKIACSIHSKLSGEPHGVWMSMQYISHYLQPLLPSIPGEYDLAVMFLGVGDTLVNKVKAKKKLTWCHTDYDSLGPCRKLDRQVYDQLDGLVTVSDHCREKAAAFYPELSQKIITIENTLAADLIRQQATEPIVDMQPVEGELHLLSIGRYCEAKNFDNVPFICKYIRGSGLNVRWYLIGYGGDEQLIKSRIEEAEMQEYVIMLGKRDNPYPYLRQCDLYVQPSRYEGKCVSVIEAQLLHKPVVITDYATAGSQLDADVDGVIVPLDNKACAAAIAQLLRRQERMALLSANTEKVDYTNSLQLNDFYRLMEIYI